MIKKISIVVTPEEEKTLKSLAKEDGRSLSSFLKRAIEEALARRASKEDSSQTADKQAA
jgi:predicted DNA-binding protein